jgi:transposase InsO family protein
VLHCPNVPINLLSIQKFCEENHCLFILTATCFLVKDIRTGQVLLQGHSRDGLYPIPLHRISTRSPLGLTAFLGLKTSTSVWHQRLGHLAMPIVQRVINHHKLPITGTSDKTSFCEPCQLAKNKCLPFVKSNRESTFPFQLVHSDVWQSPVVSLSGFRYYVTFIDDFSRFSWLFPLKLKSDVHSCFLQFKSMVENLVSQPIKSFQSNGGGEYSYTPFKQLLTQHGILHRFSCPKTSQQNGVAERKHRHVMDTGLALLAHSSLSLKYWVDAFLTAIYLINRLPTPTLSNLTPYFKLFNHSPDYHLLRSFGCACYPLMRPYNPHKLTFRSKKCVFLGYSPNHRGYRCLDLSTNRVYISRDVVFNEQDFLAKSVSFVHVPAVNSSPAEFAFLPLPTPPCNSLSAVTPHSLAPAAPIISPDTPPTLDLTPPSPNATNSPPPAPPLITALSDPPHAPNPSLTINFITQPVTLSKPSMPLLSHLNLPHLLKLLKSLHGKKPWTLNLRL